MTISKSVTYLMLAAFSAVVAPAMMAGCRSDDPGAAPIDVAPAGKGGNSGTGGRRAPSGTGGDSGSGGSAGSGSGGSVSPPASSGGAGGGNLGSGGASSSDGSTPSDDTGPAAETAEEAPVAPLCLNTVVAMGTDGLVDDFEDMDASTLMRDGRAGSWWLSISESTMVTGVMAPGPPVAVTGGQRGKALHVAGADTMANGWGVSLTASLLPEGKMGCYDVTKYTAVKLGMKGKAGSKVWVHLMTTPVVPLAEGGMGGHKRFQVTLTPMFRDITIKFTDFMDGWGQQLPLDITKVFAIDISPVIGVGATDFDFWVDNVGFVK